MSRRAERLPGGLVRLSDGTVWPSLQHAGGLEWTLRQRIFSQEDLLQAASVVEAYCVLARKEPRRAAYVLRHLRADDRRRRRGE